MVTLGVSSSGSASKEGGGDSPRGLDWNSSSSDPKLDPGLLLGPRPTLSALRTVPEPASLGWDADALETERLSWVARRWAELSYREGGTAWEGRGEADPAARSSSSERRSSSVDCPGSKGRSVTCTYHAHTWHLHAFEHVRVT